MPGFHHTPRQKRGPVANRYQRFRNSQPEESLASLRCEIMTKPNNFYEELEGRFIQDASEEVKHCTNAILCVQRTNCLWHFEDMEAVGLAALGYSSWDKLWRDYLVFTVTRSPFDRAASAFNYMLFRRGNKVRPLICFRILTKCLRHTLIL